MKSVTTSRKIRIYLLILLTCALLLAAAVLPPVSQSTLYHEFADQRSYWGIPNFLNVVSNLIFLIVGIAGLIYLRRESLLQQNQPLSAEIKSYRLVFASTAAACLGSIYYHWEPSLISLFWDRLPIAIGFMSLLAATVMERFATNWVTTYSAILLPIAGAMSTLYWLWSELYSVGNLNFYLAAQFCSIILILLLVSSFPSRYSHASEIYRILSIYGLAKLAEITDQEIYQFGNIISGHTLKHILAGLAVYFIMRMLKIRTLKPSHEIYISKK